MNIDINFFTQKYSNNLKNKENDQDFQSQFDPKAIHTNMYCKPFIGNIEKAKIFILYGNPGLALGDYQDEHHDQKYIKKLISRKIILVPNTSKTELEIKDFMKELGIRLPFICENGSAIYNLNLINPKLPKKNNS